MERHHLPCPQTDGHRRPCRHRIWTAADVTPSMESVDRLSWSWPTGTVPYFPLSDGGSYAHDETNLGEAGDMGDDERPNDHG
jgi:hypothetical protein